MTAVRQSGPFWRPTRLVAEDKDRLSRAVVEETPRGWIWTVTRGTEMTTGGRFGTLSKEQAIAEASRALTERRRPS